MRRAVHSASAVSYVVAASTWLVAADDRGDGARRRGSAGHCWCDQRAAAPQHGAQHAALRAGLRLEHAERRACARRRAPGSAGPAPYPEPSPAHHPPIMPSIMQPCSLVRCATPRRPRLKRGARGCRVVLSGRVVRARPVPAGAPPRAPGAQRGACGVGGHPSARSRPRPRAARAPP